MITRKRTVQADRYTSHVPLNRPSHRLFTGPFPALEARFLAIVRELKAGDPLRPAEILVGSNLLAVYMRRRAAEELGAVANLRFLTFVDLAKKLLPADDARPPLPALGTTLLARQAILATSESRAFGPLRDRPSLRQALVRTADDLREAGIPAADLPHLLEGAAATPDRAGFLSAVAATLVAFEQRRERFLDATALIAGAASAAIPPSGDPLLVYGLYDLGGLRERLLSAVAASRPVLAFVPDDGGVEPEGALPVRSRLFEKLLGVPASRLSGPAPAPPRIVVAPSVGGEARETVREILRAVEAGIPLYRIAILVRSPERQEAALTTELDLRRIPFFRPAGPGFSRTPLGRAARALVRLATEDFPRRDFRELLDLLDTLDLLPDLGLRDTSPSRLGAILAELGFSSGRDDLAARLASARERLDRPLSAAADPDGRFAARRARGRKELDTLERAFATVSSVLPPAGAAAWPEWSARLRRSFGLIFGRAAESGRLDPALDALTAIGAVDAAEADGAALSALFGEALDLSPEIHGRFERNGVALLSAVSARGLLFDAVLVPGLVEQSFPRPSRPDPLLFDAERKAIARESGHPLPTRADERPLREERFLFWLASTSARQRLVLLAAAKDISTDRPRLLSPFLLGSAGERARKALLSRELGRGSDPLPAEITWLPAGRLVADGPPLDEEEALRRALVRAPALRRQLPPPAAPAAAALARVAARSSPFFTPFEGKVGIGHPAPRLELRGRIVSASRLERFAGCAYRAFLERGLGLEALPESDDETPFALDALSRGNALHAAVRDVTRGLIAAHRTFGSLSATEIGAAAAEAARRAVADAAAASRNAPPPVLAEVERKHLESLVAAILRHLASSPPDLRPAGAEVRFGPSGADPADRQEDPRLSTDAAVRVEGLPFDVRLAGQIDRLDREGGHALVVDYKTGRPLPYMETNRKHHVVAGGERLQLPVYALAARLLGASRVASEYLFVREEKEGPKITVIRFDERETEEAIGHLLRVLRLADEAVRAGLFLPKTESFRSGNPCGYCEFAAVCGPGHIRLYARKWAGERDGGGRNPLVAMGEIL